MIPILPCDPIGIAMPDGWGSIRLRSRYFLPAGRRFPPPFLPNRYDSPASGDWFDNRALVHANGITGTKDPLFQQPDRVVQWHRLRYRRYATNAPQGTVKLFCTSRKNSCSGSGLLK